MNIPLLNIGKIKFYILSPSDICKLSEVNIKNYIIIQGNKPFDDGIYDLHMGTTDSSWECKTCKHKDNLCPGHYGSYKLKTNVYHPLYLQNISNILKSVCNNCGKLLNKKPKCLNCNTIAAVYQQHKSDRLVFYMNKKKIYPFQVYEIFSKITQEDVIKMGYPKKFHPVYLVPDLLLIPPNTVRPDMQFILGKNSSNELTILIQNIVKVNNILPNITKDIVIDDIDKTILDLNIAVYELMKGPYGNVLTGKRVYEGALMNQLPSKTGIIRKNLQGKQTRYMARAIIVCKCDIPIGSIGISRFIATRIQKKVYIRDYNFEECLIYYLNGTKNYPGSTKIKRLGESYTVNVDFVNKTYNLKKGDVIYRDLIDGDIVNFNRQPTLDRSSISSMKIIVFDDIDSIYFNVSCCSLFNADFDGDQMNQQIPYSTFTENEINMHSNINKVLISAKNTTILISQVLDGLIGLRMLTYNDYNVPQASAAANIAPQASAAANIAPQAPRFIRYHLLNILPMLLNFDNKNVNGKDVISAYLQTNKLYINYSGKSAMAQNIFKQFLLENSQDIMNDIINLKIVNGKMISGILDKPSIGEGEKNNIFHTILNQYGYDQTIKTIHDLQQIGLKYITHYEGFTLSCRDFIINKKCRGIIDAISNSTLDCCEIISQNYKNGLLIPPLGQTLENYYESLLLNQLESKDIALYHLFKYTTKNNNLLAIIASGTRGKMFNFKNTRSNIGLMTVGERMVSESFSNGRVCAYIPRFETNMVYKGYVAESYIEGLNPLAFLYHSYDSRNTLAVKSLCLADSGTRQRQDRKCLESFFVNNKSQVASDKYILQFLYGGDAIFPSYYIADKIHILDPNISNTDFETKYLVKDKDPIIRDKLVKEYEYLVKLRKKYITKVCYSYNTPVNMDLLFKDIKTTPVTSDTFDISKTIDLINEFLSKIYYVYYNEYYTKSYPLHIKHALKNFRIYLKSYLNIATLLSYKINDNYINCIFQQVKFRLVKSFIRYGTPIGSITTMYINEPLMQQILDSHHYTGADINSKSTTGATKGVMDEVNELFKIKDTSNTTDANMQIYLDDDYQYDRYKVEMFSFNIKMVNLINLCDKYQIINESPGESENEEENKDYNNFVKITNIKPYYNIISLCIKFYINGLAMVLHNITLENIYLTLAKYYPNFYIVYNSRFSDNLYIKVYLIKGKFTSLYDIIDFVETELLEVKLKGINNIIAAKVRDTVIQVYNNDTGVYENKKIYYIHTTGSNLFEILMLNNVNTYKTQSDSVIENYKLFGVIAARNVMIKKIQDIISVNIKHVLIYADLMTITGKCTSIDRYGNKLRNESILNRISDASPIKIILDAAINNKTDTINKASDAVLLGQVPKLGNNYNGFEIDLSKYATITDIDINNL